MSGRGAAAMVGRRDNLRSHCSLIVVLVYDETRHLPKSACARWLALALQVLRSLVGCRPCLEEASQLRLLRIVRRAGAGGVPEVADPHTQQPQRARQLPLKDVAGDVPNLLGGAQPALAGVRPCHDFESRALQLDGHCLPGQALLRHLCRELRAEVLQHLQQHLRAALVSKCPLVTDRLPVHHAVPLVVHVQAARGDAQAAVNEPLRANTRHRQHDICPQPDDISDGLGTQRLQHPLRNLADPAQLPQRLRLQPLQQSISSAGHEKLPIGLVLVGRHLREGEVWSDARTRCEAVGLLLDHRPHLVDQLGGSPRLVFGVGRLRCGAFECCRRRRLRR
mmetsp:Transcript_57557/g.163151  ORF Transcript_57557/g.163151 Transcript_57557/m.163151 type:complete len:336 (+) Transcript_57557:281-1288(+)